MPTARWELLARLLDRYERSQAYGREGPWRRDMIVRIDAAEFPEAFAPEGREALAALRLVAAELADLGAVRVVHHRGHAAGVPHEVRLGPAELPAAYRLAAAEGYVPVSEILTALAGHLRDLTAEAGGSPAWWVAFFESTAASARDGNVSRLGLSRERLKREWPSVRDALTAILALARGRGGWERVFSERLFRDSKRLASIRSYVADLLVRSDPRWDGIGPESAEDVLEAYGVRRKPGLLRCAGAVTMTVSGHIYHLEDFTPTAHLPESWATAWVDAVAESSVEIVTTIENESPFLSYIEEAGGPAQLAGRHELVVYTAGFPSIALATSLGSLALRSNALSFRHWGDADVGGLRIWSFLRERVGRPVTFFRTTAVWLANAAASAGGVALSGLERAALTRLRADLSARSWARDADVVEAVALIDTLLRLGLKVEQERF